MDPEVLRGLAKWPGVPDVYGWLQLDRRGNWLLREPEGGRFSRIGNAALRDFISRNYAADARGCWYFQNGPQRVFAALAYTPLVFHYEADALVDHCGRAQQAQEMFQDEEGSVLVLAELGIGLLDDRDLERIADDAPGMARLRRGDVPRRFGFVPKPSDSLR